MFHGDRARQIWWSDVGLIGIAVFWGSGFALSDVLIQTISPLWLLAARFSLSSLLMGPLLGRRLRGQDLRLLGAASLVGVLLGLTYVVHIYGLVLSTPGKQAFIQSSSVAMVPLLYGLWYGRWPSRPATLGAIVTTVGLFVLGFTPGMLFNAGDALSVLLAFLVALNVMMVGYLSRRMDPLALALAQILSCTALLVVGAWGCEPWPRWGELGTWQWQALGFLAVFVTVIPFLVQNVAQKYAPEVHAAILLSLESPFGYLIAVFLGRDAWHIQAALGGALILAGVMVAESERWLPGRKDGTKEKTSGGGA